MTTFKTLNFYKLSLVFLEVNLLLLPGFVVFSQDEVYVCVAQGVPHLEPGAEVAAVLIVVEVVIFGVTGPWQNSEHHPWELVT